MQELCFNKTNSHNTVQIFKFLYICAICHETNITYFVFIRNFVQKNIFISNECAISCKPGFVDTKMMRNFVQTSHFVQKRETVAQENLLFRGNPISMQLPSLNNCQKCNIFIIRDSFPNSLFIFYLFSL